ncbi:MAG: hypothetical protein KDJ52_00430 [Anaerolineae bacterium]|nr:hypothetical protein [Anaerolineae bacterium]
MNAIIEQRFDTTELHLLHSPAIVIYHILRRDVALADGKLRVKATLADGGLIELFEYVSEIKGKIYVLKYSFHWQDAHGKLKKRWDNAPHYPDLPHAPHHVHHEDDSVHGVVHPPDILTVLQVLEAHYTDNRQD